MIKSFVILRQTISPSHFIPFGGIFSTHVHLDEQIEKTELDRQSERERENKKPPSVYIQWQVHITQSKDALKILCGTQTVLLDFTTNKFVRIHIESFLFFSVVSFLFRFGWCVALGIKIQENAMNMNGSCEKWDISVKEPLELAIYFWWVDQLFFLSMWQSLSFEPTLPSFYNEK